MKRITLLIVAVAMMASLVASPALAKPIAGSGGLIKFGPHHFKPGDCGNRDGIEGSPQEVRDDLNLPPQILAAPPGNVQKICFIPTRPPV